MFTWSEKSFLGKTIFGNHDCGLSLVIANVMNDGKCNVTVCDKEITVTFKPLSNIYSYGRQITAEESTQVNAICAAVYTKDDEGWGHYEIGPNGRSITFPAGTHVSEIMLLTAFAGRPNTEDHFYVRAFKPEDGTNYVFFLHGPPYYFSVGPELPVDVKPAKG